MAGHAHAHGHSHDLDRAGSKRALSISLALTVAYGLVQVATGIWFHSLALLADAVHNVSDGAAISLALGAAWAAGLPARGARTFGWRRAEILAALVNGLALVVISLGSSTRPTRASISHPTSSAWACSWSA